MAKQTRATPSSATEAKWQELLTRGYGAPRPIRRMMGRIFDDPRCKVCWSPFTGPGSAMAAMMGRGPSKDSSTLCRRCAHAVPLGIARIDIAVLVAAVQDREASRAELGADELKARIDRFERAAGRSLIAHDAIIDQLRDGAVVAFFITGFAGQDYPLPAVQAAEEIVRAAGYGGIEPPWLPAAAAIHVGPADTGNVQTEHGIDFKATGPMVDAAWALREHAHAGELIVTDDIHARLVSGYPDSEGYPTFDRRTVEVDGAPLALRVMRLAGSGALLTTPPRG